MVTRFSLPETRAAWDEWSRRTGLDWDAPEWGEVLAALDSCGLLAADRVAQQSSLFDPPSPSGAAPRVLRLRAAIVASAELHRGGWGHDLATSALIVAAVLDRFYSDDQLCPIESLVDRLTGELPTRVYGLAPTPSAALASVLRADTLAVLAREPYMRDKPALIRLVLEEAEADDRFAERIFDRLTADPAWRLALLRLGDGRCMLYVHA
jgi:hypothetical protein